MSSATLLDAVADIRAAAQLASTIGANWYLPSDLAVLPPDDAALLIACEPVRLLAVLDAAEQVLQRDAEEINGANTATSEEGQADGDRLAGVGPAHVLSGVVTLFRDEAGVLRSTVGIDVTAMCGRPRDEFIRADHCPDNPSARCSHFVLNALGFLQPGSEAVWQEMTVSHDGLDASVVDLVIPGYSDYVRQA